MNMGMGWSALLVCRSSELLPPPYSQAFEHAPGSQMREALYAATAGRTSHL